MYARNAVQNMAACAGAATPMEVRQVYAGLKVQRNSKHDSAFTHGRSPYQPTLTQRRDMQQLLKQLYEFDRFYSNHIVDHRQHSIHRHPRDHPLSQAGCALGQTGDFFNMLAWYSTAAKPRHLNDFLALFIFLRGLRQQTIAMGLENKRRERQGKQQLGPRSQQMRLP